MVRKSKNQKRDKETDNRPVSFPLKTEFSSISLGHIDFLRPFCYDKWHFKGHFTLYFAVFSSIFI